MLPNVLAFPRKHRHGLNSRPYLGRHVEANDPVKMAAGRVSDTIGAAMLGKKRKAKRSARSRAAGKSPMRIVREADQRVPAE
jgi:hypothetical protein